ncbi:MAG: GFA family protein [Paracoccaceae bacterium]
MFGRCFCGLIRFEVDAPVQSCVTCHCESCRRQCSAPMTAYVGVRDGTWRWLSGTPKIFRSSPGVERSFCGDCGTPLSFRSEKMSGMMHLYLVAFDDPEGVTPTLHCAYEEKLDWLKLADDLPVCNGPDYTKA